MKRSGLVVVAAAILVLAAFCASQLRAQPDEAAQETAREFLSYVSKSDVQSVINISSTESIKQLGTERVTDLVNQLMAKLTPTSWQPSNASKDPENNTAGGNATGESTEEGATEKGNTDGDAADGNSETGSNREETTRNDNTENNEENDNTPNTTSGQTANKDTLVQMRPVYEPKPVVCVRENNRWRVNLVETAARWLNWSEAQKQQLISGDSSAGIMDGQGAIATCQSNLKQIALGVMQYTMDYDEVFPPARKWCDVIQPYTRSEELLHCPTAGRRKYGYAMNQNMSQHSMAALRDPANTVMFYETKTLKRNAFGYGQDFTFRHSINGKLGTNIGYADGHVKLFRKGAIKEYHFTIKAHKRHTPTTPQARGFITSDAKVTG